MSTEYSHFHRDYSYKSSRKPDYRFNKYQNPKEVTVYAPKKTYYEDERDYHDSSKSYDNYDNNRSGYRGYKPRKYPKDTRTCNHGFHLWKTEFLVKNKDQPEAESKTKEVVSKGINEGTSECESSSGKSTNYVTGDSRKSLDTLGDVNTEDTPGNTKGTIDEILEEREEDSVLKEKVKERNQENDNRVMSQETDESDEEKFSNIDLKVEKKLLENEFDGDDDEVLHEEEERPIWEDVDTKQILEDIKKGTDFLSLYPQDILILNLPGSEYKAQGNAEEDQDEEEEETEVEDLNTIFALRVLERGFSRPSLEIKNDTGAFNNNENYQESAKTANGLLPIILESPNSIYNGSQSAFLPTQYGLQTPLNRAVFKKLAQDYEANQWYYTGNDGFMQGPFSSRQMDEWYIMGYLPLDLEINLQESKGFRRLRELVDIINREGDFLFNNMKEIIAWFNHGTTEDEEELYPPGIPISPSKLAAANAQKKKRMEPQTAGLLPGKAVPLRECVSASLMGPKRLAAFNVYHQEELNNEDCYSNGVESHCKLPRNDSPLNSGISNHSFHNSPVNNNCFNPSSVLPFPNNDAAVKSSPGCSRNGNCNNNRQEDFAYAWKSFVNYKN